MSNYEITFQGNSSFGNYVFKPVPTIGPAKNLYPWVCQRDGEWCFAVFEAEKIERWPCFIGPYSNATHAFFAACRYAYGPIPRDFRPQYPRVVGLEALFERPLERMGSE